MGGMCLGSLLFPRFVSERSNPFRVYTAVEIGIAVLGIFVLFVIPILTQSALAAMCLLPPTILLGATLPVLSAAVQGENLAAVYAANLAGGVVGCPLTGFCLLRVYDVSTFFELFPNGTIWGNPYEGRGHDMVLLGRAEPLRIDLDEMERCFGYRDEANRVPQSLTEVGFDSPVELFATYAGRCGRFDRLAPWGGDQSRPKLADAASRGIRIEPR